MSNIQQNQTTTLSINDDCLDNNRNNNSNSCKNLTSPTTLQSPSSPLSSTTMINNRQMMIKSRGYLSAYNNSIGNTGSGNGGAPILLSVPNINGCPPRRRHSWICG
nr:rho GTPase-activating protein gacF-like [Dermatophagoides pteronyssinus]